MIEALKTGFIGSTVGLECNGFDRVGKMIKVEYTRNPDRTVTLSAVSGRNGCKTNGGVTLSADQFSNRPSDPYDNIKEARWALNLVGWSLMSDDAQ